MNALTFPEIPWKDADGWHVLGGTGGQIVATMETESEAVSMAKARNEKAKKVLAVLLAIALIALTFASCSPMTHITDDRIVLRGVVHAQEEVGVVLERFDSTIYIPDAEGQDLLSIREGFNVVVRAHVVEYEYINWIEDVELLEVDDHE
jgi:hypothetical protein